MDTEFHKSRFLDRQSNNQGYWSSTMPRQYLKTPEKQLPDCLHCTSSVYLNAPVTIQNKDLLRDSVEKKIPEGVVSDGERKLLWGKLLEKGMKGHWPTIIGWGRKVDVVLKETPWSSSARNWLEADVVEKITEVETEATPSPIEGLRTTNPTMQLVLTPWSPGFCSLGKRVPFHNGQTWCAQLPQSPGMQHNQRDPVQCYHHSHRALTTCNNHSG